MNPEPYVIIVLGSSASCLMEGLASGKCELPFIDSEEEGRLELVELADMMALLGFSSKSLWGSSLKPIRVILTSRDRPPVSLCMNSPEVYWLYSNCSLLCLLKEEIRLEFVVSLPVVTDYIAGFIIYSPLLSLMSLTRLEFSVVLSLLALFYVEMAFSSSSLALISLSSLF